MIQKIESYKSIKEKIIKQNKNVEKKIEKMNTLIIELKIKKKKLIEIER